MEKGKQYNYNEIERFAEINDYEIESFGNERIGENFLLLSDNQSDKVISYVLSGSSCNGYMYECVYTDI